MSVFDNRSQLLSAFRNGDVATLIWLQTNHAPRLRTRLSDGFTCQAEGVDLIIQGDWDEATLDRLIMETFRRAFSEEQRMSYRGERSFYEHLFDLARDVIVNDLVRAGLTKSTFSHRPVMVAVTVNAPKYPPPSRQFDVPARTSTGSGRRWLVGTSRDVTRVSRLSEILALPCVTLITILLSSAYPIWSAVP